MSRHVESFTVPFPLAVVQEACCAAAPAAGMTLTLRLPAAVRAKESFRLFSFSWPAEMWVRLHEPGPGWTAVELAVSNFGWGPIQGGHVRQVAERLRGHICQASVQTAAQRGLPLPWDTGAPAR